MRALRLLPVLGVVLGALAAVPAAAAPALPDRYVVPGPAVFPEGIALRGHGPTFFVGSVTDGTVFRGDVRDAELHPWLPAGSDGRTSALGMTVDAADRLVVAGGATGTVHVHAAGTGRLLHRFSTGRTDGFLNDVAVTPHGDVYVTDSFQPVLYRITAAELAGPDVDRPLQPFADLTGSPVAYEPGFNLNGIVASADGRHLLVADSNSSALYRIGTAHDAHPGRTDRVEVTGGPVAGDGLLLRGRTLYAVDANDHTVVRLAVDGPLTAARVVARTADPALRGPSTVAASAGDLLVVNFQVDRLVAGLPPELPFDVVRLPRPQAPAP